MRSWQPRSDPISVDSGGLHLHGLVYKLVCLLYMVILSVVIAMASKGFFQDFPSMVQCQLCCKVSYKSASIAPGCNGPQSAKALSNVFPPDTSSRRQPLHLHCILDSPQCGWDWVQCILWNLCNGSCNFNTLNANGTHPFLFRSRLSVLWTFLCLLYSSACIAKFIHIRSDWSLQAAFASPLAGGDLGTISSYLLLSLWLPT